MTPIAPWLRTAVVGCALALAAPAAAQRPDTTPDLTRLWITPGRATLVLDSTDLANTGARTLSEALAARVPGLSVTRTSGMSGAASRIVLRGSEAYLGMAEPLIVIDGVQVNGGELLFQNIMEGTSVALLDDLPLAAVERVELLRSPSDLAAHGAGANRGVLRITTRGAAGSALSGRVAAQVTTATDRSVVPPNFRRTWQGAPEYACPLYAEAAGECTGGVLMRWNPVRTSSPFQQGLERSYRAGVSGALPGSGVRLSGTAAHDEGEGFVARNEIRRSSALAKAMFTPWSGLDVLVGARLNASLRGLPLTEGFGGLLGRGLLGFAQDDPVTRGYFGMAPEQYALLDGEHRMAQSGVQLSASWAVHPRMVISMATGYDRATQASERFAKVYETIDSPVRGSWISADHRLLVAQARAAWRHRAPTNLSLTSFLGVQYTESERRERQDLMIPPGTHFVRLVHDRPTATGLVVGEQVVWNGSRLLTVGVRHESMSMRGVSLDDQLLPWGRVEWTVSEEAFFPRTPLLGTVRLRAEAAKLVDPQQLQYDPLTVTMFGVQGGDSPRALRQTATELALRLASMNDRASLELRATRRNSRDGAHIEPAASAVLFHMIHRNAASWTASGAEAELALRPLIRDRISWETRGVFGSYRVRTDAFAAPYNLLPYSPIYPFSHSYGVERGVSFVGYRGFRVSYDDPDGDGLLRYEDVEFDHELMTLGGSPLPRRELGWINTIKLGRHLAVTTHVDHRGGHERVDNTEYFRCLRYTCRGLWDPSSTLAEQARAIAATRGVWNAFLQDATFTRLREVSARWQLPFAVYGGRGAAFLTASGRNLALWTKFQGADPEVGTVRGRIFDQGTMFNAALPREFSVRLDMSY